MRRLNVQFEQIGECIRLSMFAMSYNPSNPPLSPGEILLLQVTKNTSDKLNIPQRVQFAIEFDRIEKDINHKSLTIWGREWNYIIYGKRTIATIPFNIENLPGIGDKYAGQTQGILIDPEDEKLIQPFIDATQDDQKAVDAREFGEDRLAAALSNYDSIAEILSKEDYSVVRERITPYYSRNPWTAQALKSLYDHKCQICEHDFKPRYNVPFAETHHIEKVSLQNKHNAPLDKAKNIIVLCPNHHRIIEKTNALFIPAEKVFKYPNGFSEVVKLDKHLNYKGPNYNN